MQTRLIVVTKAVEQKQSKEQKLLQYDDGNNWYGKNPILHLIHTGGAPTRDRGVLDAAVV